MKNLGISGRLTQAFIVSPLTPLLLLAAIVVGAIALVALPREEEPQISVPMIDIIVQANGYKAQDAVELVTRPLEDIVKGIEGVEHVYSQSMDDKVVVTARFFVGTNQDSAVLRAHEKIRSHIAELPKGLPEPLIIGRGVDDVATVVLTISANGSAAGRWDDNGLHGIAEELQHELTKVENIGASYIVGGSSSQIRIEPDPDRLALYGMTLAQVADKKPDFVYLPDYYNIVNLVTQQAKEKGINVPFGGGDGWDSSDLDLTAAAGGYFTNHYSPEDPRAEVQNFVTNFGAKYKNDQGQAAVPDALAALAYDATNLLLQGITDAKTEDTAKVADALRAITFNGVSGKITFDAQHNPVKSATILAVTEGGIKFNSVVNP